IARPMRISHHAFDCAQCLIRIRPFASEPTAGRIAMQDDGAKRLVHFMRDRSREVPEGCQTCDASECRLGCAQGGLGFALFRHVNKCTCVFHEYAVLVEYGASNTANVSHTVGSEDSEFVIKADALVHRARKALFHRWKI